MFQVINPYSKEIVAEYEYTTGENIEKSLNILYKNRSTAHNIPVYQRADILNQLGDLLVKHKESLARLIVIETGKTITDARVELDRAKATCEATAVEIRSLKGETLNSDAYGSTRQRIGVVNWFPLGVVYCITPFNFPINIGIHKIAPAFAAGNAILYKASEFNYLSCEYLIKLCYEAGIPKDILLPVYPESNYYARINADSRVQAINFTGGTQVGRQITSEAGMKPLLMELGGNDPFIVMEDADIKYAVSVAISQRFGTAGQRCTAPKRFYIHADIKDEFIDQLVKETQKLVVGDPMSDSTFVGPVIHEKAACQIQQRIQQACKMGAQLLAGGQRENSIVFPTILDSVSDDAEIIVEETFGPVIPIQSFKKLDEVIQKVNRSEYGLQSAVFTKDIGIARRLYDSLEVGALIVNDGPGFRAEHFPFGGVKSSGLGREGVGYSIRAMSQQKLWVI